MPQTFKSKAELLKRGLNKVTTVGIIAMVICYFIWWPLAAVTGLGLVAVHYLARRDLRSFKESGELYLGGKDVTLIDRSKHHPASIPFAVVMDVETTGLLADNTRPTRTKVEAHPNWYPRIVQIAWVTLDRRYRVVEQHSYYIKQTEPIPPNAIAIHKITDEICLREGKELVSVLNAFKQSIQQCDYYVGHNVQFDKYVIQAECLKAGIPDPFVYMKKYDTQIMGKRLVRRRKSTLHQLAVSVIGNEELVKLGVQFHNAHDDVWVTASIFAALHERGIKF